MEGLDRTVASRLTLNWLCCKPLLERSVYPCLPARAAGSKGADDFLIQADGNLLFRRLLIRATHSSQRGNRCTHATTRSGDCGTPVDFGLSRRPSEGIRLCGCDLGRAKVR
jgi:hypothetical protein